MKKKTAWIKCMGMALILIGIFSAAYIPAKAADMTECIGIVIGYDSDGEVVYASPGIPVNVNGTLGVYASTYDIDSGEVTVAGLVVASDVYKLVYGETGELITGYDYEATIWVLEEEAQDTENDTFLQLGKAHQNETVTAVYLNQDNEQAAMSMTLLECNEDGFLTADNYPTNIYYPAELVNESRELVGIILDDGAVYAVGGDREAFYAEGEETSQREETLSEQEEDDTPPIAPDDDSQNEEKAPPLPSREEKVSDAEEVSEAETSGTAVSEPQPVKRSSSSQSAVIAGVLIGIAAVAVVVIIVFKSKKKKTSTSRQETDPQVEDTGKTMPLAEESVSSFEAAAKNRSVQQSKLWLAAVGGYMNGRVYPIEDNEITIGRDTASVIRYPADTAGVSRVHAKLYWQNGQLMLMDCNSTSGTYLKRQGKLAPMQPAAVQSGDIFYIGEKINSFEIKN